LALLVALPEGEALRVPRGHPQMRARRQAWAEKQADALAPTDPRSERDGRRAVPTAPLAEIVAASRAEQAATKPEAVETGEPKQPPTAARHYSRPEALVAFRVEALVASRVEPQVALPGVAQVAPPGVARGVPPAVARALRSPAAALEASHVAVRQSLRLLTAT
jgi:hypothetical protein